MVCLVEMDEILGVRSGDLSKEKWVAGVKYFEDLDVECILRSKFSDLILFYLSIHLMFQDMCTSTFHTTAELKLIPEDLFYVTVNGKIVDWKKLDEDTRFHVHFRLRGGKGGYFRFHISYLF